jgi:aerobic-type carbon monoxide dehydrogenase small subunit (CoxS/CutS family)
MPNFTLFVNNKKETVNVDADTPLLWVLRDALELTGTKYSCGEGICGTCTVHLNGEAVRSCSITINEASDKSVVTIEGFAADPSNAIIKSWIEEEVPQCGYCQPGQIMAFAALYQKNPNPSKKEVENTMNDVLCRCGTYPRIRIAIEKIVEHGGAL